MADEPVAEHLDEQSEDEEGGPVKSFLEHLEDLRWVLIKSLVALGVAILICLIGGDYVVGILKCPLQRTKIAYPGTNQVVTVLFGTNRLGVYPAHARTASLARPWQQPLCRLSGSNPSPLAPTRCSAWRVDADPGLAEQAQRANIDLINLSPASGFFVAFQVALYGGMLLASPFIFYFVAGVCVSRRSR